MSHRQIMKALSGLLLGMFVAVLSSTIVSAALPSIISDLHGSQSSYTWVVRASTLSMIVTIPLWGKLADLSSKKMLVQLAITVFVLSSAGAGFAQNPSMLIAFRLFQGMGAGGLIVLAQVIMAAMITPRERGRYSGYLGATFAVATLVGPLLSGVIADTSWLGWRWCFYVVVPFAVVALIVLRRTLHLPEIRRKDVKVDWLGASFIAAAACLPLLWVTFAGDKYDWISWQTYAMIGGTVVLALLFVLVESRAKEPIVPLRLFHNRTITLAAVGSVFVGIAMFGATVFLHQYFQVARGKSPTVAGVMTVPVIAGLFVSAIVSGQIISRTGKSKVWLCSGGVSMTAGMGLLGTLGADTPYWHTAIFMALLGLGIGMMMQNLVLATQNQVDPTDLGSASSTVNSFRELGGAVGVSVLGAVMATRVTHYMEGEVLKDGGSAPRNLDEGPSSVRSVLEGSYGQSIGDIYLYAAPVALLALLCVLFIKEVPLRTQSGIEQEANPQPVPAASGVPADSAPAVGRTAEQLVAQAVGTHGDSHYTGPGAESVFGKLEPDDPEQVGGYVLAARLGSGGMGRVYLSHTLAGRPVAIKVVRAELADDPEFRRRFRREVAAARRVHGLYTAPVIDSQVDGSVLWLATAHVSGPTLTAAVSRHGALPAPAVLLLAAGVAEALQEVHGAGIVHRDLKPSNVLLATDGPRVIDFGIARAADATALTDTGVVVGTPTFMSPEQAVNREVGPPTDIFSLGQLVAYAVTGTPAFGEGPGFGVLYRIVHEEPDLTDAPEILLPLLNRCLAKEPDERPSPAEVIDLCRAAFAGNTLRRSEDWLPKAITLDVTRHQNALSAHTW